MEQITLRIPKDTLADIEREAEEHGETRSEYIREILETRTEYDSEHGEDQCVPIETHAELQREYAELQAEHGEGECVPVEGASIEGPAMLLVGQTGLYTATYTPPTATLPLTITWDNGSVGPTAAYSWTLSGTYTLTVTATNCQGTGVATATHIISVEPSAWQVYLPFILKQEVPGR